MDSTHLEDCIMDIKRSLARMEEQIKTLFLSFDRHLAQAREDYDSGFAGINGLGKEISTIHRELDVRVSRHDGELETIQKDIASIKVLLEAISLNTQKAKGVAVGLGMAGGAAISVISLLVQFWKG